MFKMIRRMFLRKHLGRVGTCAGQEALQLRRMTGWRWITNLATNS